jgi:fatty-acid desaturase
VNLNYKIRLLQTVAHIISIPAIAYALYTNQYYLIGIAFISWVIVGPISCVITLHRLLTHRSFKTYPWLEKMLSYVSVISTVGPTISWVALHRHHHANSDKNGDPHSAYVDNKFSFTQAFKVWLGYDWDISSIPVSYVKDLMRNPTHKFIFKNYFKIIFVFSLILIIIDPVLWVFAYAVPVSMTIHLIGIVNVLGHRHGYRNYNTNDNSTNSWIANIVSFGDGWHNNHHARPGNYYLRERWWEWDLMGLIIKVIKK